MTSSLSGHRALRRSVQRARAATPPLRNTEFSFTGAGAQTQGLLPQDGNAGRGRPAHRQGLDGSAKGLHPTGGDDRPAPSQEVVLDLLELPACPSGRVSPQIRPPKFGKADANTQKCFAELYSSDRWPETDCCSLRTHETSSCDVPGSVLIEWAKIQVPNFDNYYARDAKITGRPQNSAPTITGKKPNDHPLPRDPTEEDLEFFAASVAFLWQNWDAALWATCLATSWAPEEESREIPQRLHLLKGLSYGGYRGGLHVTFVDHSRTNGAVAWAFGYLPGKAAEDGTVGIIVPVETQAWRNYLTDYFECGGAHALCAVSQFAAAILHEMVHIVGPAIGESGVGVAQHAEPECKNTDRRNSPPTPEYPEGCIRWPCWDEPRMSASMFLYAMKKRYSCLDAASRCSNLDDPRFFAESVVVDTSGEPKNTQRRRQVTPACNVPDLGGGRPGGLG